MLSFLHITAETLMYGCSIFPLENRARTQRSPIQSFCRISAYLCQGSRKRPLFAYSCSFVFAVVVLCGIGGGGGSGGAVVGRSKIATCDKAKHEVERVLCVCV